MLTFDAAVLWPDSARLAIERLHIDSLGEEEVLVELRASGLCHTDLEIMEGSLGYPRPIVLGHEGAGVVVECGPRVSSVHVGDHVICSWNPNCGHCFYCDRDMPILCEPVTQTMRKGVLPSGASRLRCGERVVHHFSGVSSHSRYAVVSARAAIVVPKDLPFDRACLIGCGVMTGVGAVTRLLKVEPGSSVLVIGCGAVGLNAIQGAVLAGAATIIAIDRDAGKIARATKFGATHTLCPRSSNDEAQAAEAVRGMTGGRGADHVVEAAGAPAAMQLALEACRPGGHVVFLGKIAPNAALAIRWGSLMGEKNIVRSSYGGARPQRDFPWMAQLYLEGKLKLDELITSRISLQQINDGFDAMRRGEGVRTVIQY